MLSEAAGGRTLPTLAVLRAYVRACGGDVRAAEERWRAAADQRRADQPATAALPLPGLASHEVEHAGLFFGREALTRDLLQRLEDGGSWRCSGRPAAGSPRCCAPGYSPPCGAAS